MKSTRTRAMLYMAVMVVCMVARTQAISHNSSQSKMYRRSSGSMFSRVQFHDSGTRKRTISSTATPFGHTICFFFDPDYKDPRLRLMVLRTMASFENHLCVKFIDVTNTRNTSDSSWGMNHGCQSNVFLRINNESQCYAQIGVQSGSTEVVASVCSDYYTIEHEMFHVLTSMHELQDSTAQSIASVYPDNIEPGYMDSYMPTSETKGDGADGQSTLMYSQTTWSKNCDPTYSCMRQGKCFSFKVTQEYKIFKELNEIYKCNEFSCGNATVNCGRGYYAKAYNACQCVCPVNFDPDTNCASFINGPNTKLKWPTNAVLGAGGADNTCPSGTGPTGFLSVIGLKLGADNGPFKFPTNGKNTTYLTFCAVNSSARGNTSNWPIGGYFCLGKEKGCPCGGEFNDFQINYTSYGRVAINGSCGDITVSGNVTTLRFCCRDEYQHGYIQLPNDKDFRLWTGSECPNIEGMRGYEYSISLVVAGATWGGGPVQFQYFNMSWAFYMGMCYYMSPVYGCNQMVNFGIGQRSVTFTTPGFPQARLPNRRCFYGVTSEIAAFMVVSVTNFSLAVADYFFMNPYSGWEESIKVDNSNPITDLVSERNIMSFEFWSSYQNVSNIGVNFTVNMLLRSELCYDYYTRGADYMSTVNISEQYEPCLDWTTTNDCYEAPYDSYEGVQGFYSSNHCRNPKGKLLQPWCFVYKKGRNCEKRYCDVCQLRRVVDVFSTSVCSQAISTNPNFCSTAVQRYGCAKSCNLIRPTADCPTSYMSYGDRCLYMSLNALTYTEAVQYCSSRGFNGSLVRVMRDDDNNFLHHIRKEKAYSKNMWVDATINAGDTQWKYSGTDISLVYSNWTGEVAKSYTTKSCGALLPQDDLKAGSWGAFACMDPNIRNAFFCQSQRRALCPSPVLPADGVLTDPSKTFYHEGDRMTIQCKYSLDPSPKQIMCKGGRWTDLQSACSVCPMDWYLYTEGNVCVYYRPQNLTIKDAENFCHVQAPERNSTLFRVTSESDYTFARDYRRLKGRICCDNMYISGRISNKRWIYTNSPDVPIPFINMTESQIKSCKNNSFTYIYREASTSGRGGSQNCLTDESWSSMPFCQMDKLPQIASDKYSSCQKALSENPRFCSYKLAPSLCMASCGVVDGGKNCSEPVSSNYTRVSNKTSISPGEFMTFTCKPGYFLVGGNTQRACGLNGDLLGQEPQCINDPKTWNVGLDQITARLDTLPSQMCFLLDRDEYKVPFDGKIIAWYCRTATAGTIVFVVFRKIGSNYKYVGSNAVQCVPKVLWGIYVASSIQITVKQGDVVGAYSEDDETLEGTICDYCNDNSFQLPVATVNNASRLPSAVFSSNSCMLLNMGYQMSN